MQGAFKVRIFLQINIADRKLLDFVAGKKSSPETDRCFRGADCYNGSRFFFRRRRPGQDYIRRIDTDIGEKFHVVELVDLRLQARCLRQSLFEPLPQVLQNVRFKKGSPLEDARVKSSIEAGNARLNGSGRILVRKSGTEPVIRVMAEGDDEKLVRAVVRDIAAAIEEVAA